MSATDTAGRYALLFLAVCGAAAVASIGGGAVEHAGWVSDADFFAGFVTGAAYVGIHSRLFPKEPQR